MSNKTQPDLGQAYDAILRTAKEELERLQGEVRLKQVFIEELMKLRHSDRAREVSERTRTTAGNGHAGTWAERIDRVFTAKPGEKLSAGDIAKVLGAINGRFEGMRIPADVLIRSNLRLRQEKYGWKFKKKGHRVVWWKETG